MRYETLYDEIVKSVDLTDDELTILKELLSYRLDQSASIGEEITVRELLEKLNVKYYRRDFINPAYNIILFDKIFTVCYSLRF